MSTRRMASILAFLFVYFVLASYVVGSAWNASPVAQPVAAVGEEPAEPDPIVHIDSVIPAVVVARDDSVGVLLFGSGFGPGTVVLVNGAPATTARPLSPDRLYLQLTPEEQRSASVLAVTVRAGGDAAAPSSNIAMVVVRDADLALLEWRFWLFGSRAVSITAETRFLILTLLMGSLGGVLASINSIGMYRGEDRLFGNWTIHYLVSPFVAGGVALFLYFTIRAGFLSGTNVSIAPTGFPWGLLAISALAGMFYDRSFLKLREVFLTLFRTEDPRSGKLEGEDEESADGKDEVDEVEEAVGAPPPSPRITTAALPPAAVGRPYETRLAAEGEAQNLSWSVLPDLPGGLQLHPGTGEISGTPVEVTPARSYVFAVETLEGTRASTSLELEVTP